MKIYPINARIPIRVGDVTFHVSPLSLAGRMQLGEYIMRRGGAEMRYDMAYAMKCLQLCIKKIEGVEALDGKPYEIRFDDQGFMTDESLEEIQQVLGSAQVASVVSSLIGNMADPNLPGVKVDFENVYLEEAKKKT